MGDKANVLVGVAEITLGVGVDAKVIGYTVDGATMTVRSDFANVKVDQQEGSVIRKLIDQGVEISLNIAEGDLDTLAAAIPGCSLNVGGDVLTLGGTELQAFRLTLVGLNPGLHERVLVLTNVNPTGEVGMPYKKGAVSVVPVTFAALVNDVGEFGDLVDATAAPPTFVEAETDDIDGKTITVTFSKNMANPVGKQLEFWFTEDTVERSFNAIALNGTAAFDLTVSGAGIATGTDVLLFYARGTIWSDDDGILGSLAGEEVENNVPA